PSRHVLRRVREEKKTFWQVPGQAAIEATTLLGVEAVVAAPVLDCQGQVIAALYGERRDRPQAPGSPPMTRLGAMLVELLARGVAAGLARVRQEAKTRAARVQFEQFFTPELSRHLATEPDLLKGREAIVSVLFCDIRNFSRFSRVLGPDRTFRWIGDV